MPLFPFHRRQFASLVLLVSATLLAPALHAAPPPAASAKAVSLRTRATSTTALTVASAANGKGSAVLLMATVDSASGAAAGGSVVFTAQGKRIGEARIDKGEASLTVSALPNGLSTLSATYGGDANCLPSKSATVRFYNDDQD